MHHHRAEHWIVVRGTAQVTRGDGSYLVSENESTFIPLGTRHRLENPGCVPLEMIEVHRAHIWARMILYVLRMFTGDKNLETPAITSNATHFNGRIRYI